MPAKYVFILVCCLTTIGCPGTRNCLAQQVLPSETFTVKEGLSENVVHSLFQDRKGFIWIGTHEGLNRYDGYGFKKFFHDKQDSTSLPNSPVSYIMEDKRGDLFIYTTYGLRKMDPYTGDFSPAFSTPGLSVFGRGRETMAKQVFRSAERFAFDPYWIISRNSPGTMVSLKQQAALQNKLFEAGMIDRFNQLWLVDKTSVRVIDSSAKEFILIDGLVIPNHKNSRNPLLLDANGNVWIRTAEKIYCIDQQTRKVKTVLYQEQMADFLFENIQTLLLDRSGVLWIGSFYGIRKVNLNYQRFNHFVNGVGSGGLASNFVLGLKILGDNKMAVQHYFLEPLYTVLDLATGESQKIRIDQVPAAQFLKEALIHHPERVKDNSWAGQVARIIRSGFQLQYLRFGYTDTYGRIWSFYNTGEVINFADSNRIRINGTADGLWDDGKYLWVTASEDGLVRYEMSSGQIKKYQASSQTGAISTNNLLCFSADQKGNFWIGTRGGGLNYFDKLKERFVHYSEKDGLGSNTIYCMVFDDQQRLWMGTSRGISCFDPATGLFRNFYAADGLVNTEFNRWSAVKDKNGRLYFGGMNGIDHFDPNEVLQSKQVAPTVYITEFKTGNTSQVMEQNAALPHQQNFISFEFAAMNFRNPSATQYRYMLQGATNEWIDAANNHTAVFASLQPGKYVFKVKAATQNGIWGPEESFAFRIKAPWWKQAWFYIACILLLTGGLYGLYKFRITQLRKLIHVRSKISQDLHDEMGATLTSISFLSEVAYQQTATQNTAAAQTITKIGEYSRDMIGEMNDIVWAINPANDKFEKIEDRMHNFARPLLSARNIQFDLVTDASLKLVSLNMEQRKNLYLIFKEAVNNAAKYSGSDSVKVQMIRENNHIELNISDNGKGFDKTSIQPGNGLINMEQRAKEIKAAITINSEPGKGTRVNLVMPLTQNT